MTTQTPTPEQLQVMYNNFVKISQWLTKKDQAPSPLPPLYADILAELKALRDKVEDLEFKQAANFEEIHYLQGLIERNKTEQGEAIPEQKKSKPKTSRKKKTEQEGEANQEVAPQEVAPQEVAPQEVAPQEEELPSAPSLIPAPAHLKEQEVSANESETEQEVQNEPLDIELDSTVFTSVSEEVSRLLDEINKKEDEDDTD